METHALGNSLVASTGAVASGAVAQQTENYASGVLSGNYVLLMVGDLQMLVPQTDVVHTGYLPTKTSSNDLSGAGALGALGALGLSAGLVEQPERADDVMRIAVSEELLLEPTVPEDCFVYTVHADAPEVHWCWNDVRVLIDLNGVVAPLPKVMLSPNTPLMAIATLPDGSYALCTRAHRLLQFVSQQMR